MNNSFSSSETASTSSLTNRLIPTKFQNSSNNSVSSFNWQNDGTILGHAKKSSYELTKQVKLTL